MKKEGNEKCMRRNAFLALPPALVDTVADFFR
jgi:hypothetical protein